MLRPLETAYLVIGVGIIVRGSIDHSLTTTELAAALFFIGLTPVSKVDKEHQRMIDTDVEKKLLDWLLRRPPS